MIIRLRLGPISRSSGSSFRLRFSLRGLPFEVCEEVSAVTYVPRDPDGRPKTWFYYLVGLIFVVAITAMIIAFVARH